MKRLQFLQLGLLAMATVFTGLTGCQTASQNSKTFAPETVYEMRIYNSPEGKLEDLHNRFRNHTLRLFQKHGIQSVGYWVPVNNTNNQLYFLLAYPSKQARENSWKAFMADPEWQAAMKASEANGKIVSKAENYFLKATDYSPTFKMEQSSTPRVFELRTYVASAGNLHHLDDRFRNHTIRLFEKHGMKNLVYWHVLPGEKGADNMLIYLLSHNSPEAAGASFRAFGQDPDWQTARKASEQKAGGSLTAPGGVRSVFLRPTDYSPLK
jgi:hypothetical protein